MKCAAINARDQRKKLTALGPSAPGGAWHVECSAPRSHQRPGRSPASARWVARSHRPGLEARSRALSYGVCTPTRPKKRRFYTTQWCPGGRAILPAPSNHSKTPPCIARVENAPHSMSPPHTPPSPRSHGSSDEDPLGSSPNGISARPFCESNTHETRSRTDKRLRSPPVGVRESPNG